MKEEENKKGSFNPFPNMEEEVLEFWDKAEIFKKSLDGVNPLNPPLEGGQKRPDYVFYDGPPFATGTPHYGHIVASVMKDAVPRYWTMKGFRVERRWGWDCHGLPVENLAEKELELKDKTDIEKKGVECFNDYCQGIVMRYASEWKTIIKRIGRWVDMENDYKTMDPNYMESIWWVFKTLWDKGLIYKGYKSMHICPRCGTTLSNFEVAQGYKDIKDLSAIVKFEITNFHELETNLTNHEKFYILAWTTTPWTLIGNVALAVGEKIEYIKIKYDGVAIKPERKEKNETIKYSNITPGTYILAKDILWKNLQSNAGLMQELRILIGYYNNEEMEKDILDNISVEEFFKKYNLEIIKGEDLVGLKYKPLFDYYAGRPKSALSQHESASWENGWKIYGADFVTTAEGTGVVHIAPAFGDDDLNLGKKYNLPFVQHVDMDGRIKAEVVDFAGLEVKPKDDHMKTDIEIIKYLAHKNSLFGKEKYEHSYPHCWRCDSPLLNYATDSYFVEVTKIKDQLIANNRKVRWIPEHIRDGRFGKWLEQARDWAISRNRYWGAPLPVWICGGCGETKVIGSIDELKANSKNITKLILVRHGQSKKNINEIFDSLDNGFPLTEKGKTQAENLAKILKDEKINKIYSSPVERARETAEIVAKKIGADIEIAEELREINSGNWQGKSPDHKDVKTAREEYHRLLMEENYIAKRGKTGESWKDIEERSYAFAKKAIEANKGKTIVFITHQGVLVYLMKALTDISLERTVSLFSESKYQNNAFPLAVFVDGNTKKEINLHKQFADKIEFACQKCGGSMRRVAEVLDCWFESGSMPYAEEHYPFENKEKFENNFPADFIAEGVDQTRGWFYTMMVLATALFGREAAKNIIVNGIVLAEDGQKMSKRLKNYPDPTYLFDMYSVDALRYYLLSSPVLAAENLNFSEDGVKDVLRKVEMILWNVVKFYELFGNTNSHEKTPPPPCKGGVNILDQWILARLDQLLIEVTDNMDKYDLPRATRPIEEFISDLSTWYIRRSRDRFKSSENEDDKNSALATTKFVLIELAKIMAPFMPFLAEQIWQRMTGFDFKDENKSVHLEKWPSFAKAIVGKPKSDNRQQTTDNRIIEEMETVRKIVEMGLGKRDEAGVKVRQPLQKLKVSAKGGSAFGGKSEENYLKLIKDEVNVKEVLFEEKDGEMEVELDLNITDELKLEGAKREIVRFVNALRKDAGLSVGDRIMLYWQSEDLEIKKVFEKFDSELLKDVLADQIMNEKDESLLVEKSVKVNEAAVWLGIKLK